MSRNDEIVVHICSTDTGSQSIYDSVHEAVDNYWENAESIGSEQYNNYRKIWTNNQKKLDRLEEKYGPSKSSKPLIKSGIFSIDWPEYYEKIQNDMFHSFAGRIELLSIAHNYFSENAHFSEMDQIQRREIAGIATSNQNGSTIGWGWFGSMVGAGKFQNRINDNNEFISQALDAIPLQDRVYKSNYLDFVSLFKRAFPDGGSGVAIASRLLTMKRPDYFVCLDKQNRPKLCEEFGIAKTVSFAGYWDDIIERIHDSIWWSSERPSDGIELLAWKGRSAMLDAIFYEEQ
ncbi:hypothetical protein ANRL3_02126 [Anaerolineae bacterium]|nr:hypothetical protein ANRL3_02126 [Anaerolineae bacterium]